jgi:hypothetical protein
MQDKYQSGITEREAEEMREQARARQDRENRIKMNKRALEITCYVGGAGAFSVFIRWLQTMQAFNEQGLVDKSFWNVGVPLIIFATAFMVLRFIDRARNMRYYLPEDFFQALSNPGKAFTIVRWAVGAVMTAGAVLLLMESETDKDAGFYLVLALLGIVNGLVYPVLLTAANKPLASRPSLVCFCAFVPILFFSVWLITCFRVNSINSVLWSYGLEIITIIVALLAFYHMAGFAFNSADPWRSMFFAMQGSAMCIMIMADERYMGLEIMYLGSALMLLLYNWIMITNLRQRPKEQKEQPNDGFERL